MRFGWQRNKLCQTLATETIRAGRINRFCSLRFADNRKNIKHRPSSTWNTLGFVSHIRFYFEGKKTPTGSVAIYSRVDLTVVRRDAGSTNSSGGGVVVGGWTEDVWFLEEKVASVWGRLPAAHQTLWTQSTRIVTCHQLPSHEDWRVDLPCPGVRCGHAGRR